jgi:hypothetical protein
MKNSNGVLPPRMAQFDCQETMFVILIFHNESGFYLNTNHGSERVLSTFQTGHLIYTFRRGISRAPIRESASPPN